VANSYKNATDDTQNIIPLTTIIAEYDKPWTMPKAMWTPPNPIIRLR
jgi:hypothetical protein